MLLLYYYNITGIQYKLVRKAPIIQSYRIARTLYLCRGSSDMANVHLVSQLPLYGTGCRQILEMYDLLKS